MSINPEKPKGRRSSLKIHNINGLTPSELMKIKNKRNSVSWGQASTFQFKEIKDMFKEIEKNDINKSLKEDEKNNEFLELRKRSIKNEFSLVKELMKKNKNIMEDDNMDIDDEVKENTGKNIILGKNIKKEGSDTSDKDESKSDISEEDN